MCSVIFRTVERLSGTLGGREGLVLVIIIIFACG